MTGERPVVHLEHPVRRSRRELWDACATAAGLEGWYADRVTGKFEVGGSVRLEWPDLGAAVDLSVSECSPERRIAFAGGENRVTLTLSEGSLALTHEGLDEADDLAGFHSSWRVALSHLSHALEVHAGRTRHATWWVRRARTSAEMAHLCFTEPSALERWLGQTAGLDPEGGRYSVKLEDGRTVSGRVLVRESGHDVALSWEGAGGDSVLSLRTLPSPRGEAERLLALCWSTWAPIGGAEAKDPAVVRLLTSAVDRLVTVLARAGDA
jgi:uncharacterized protein YndB with AHSA1/START domain